MSGEYNVALSPINQTNQYLCSVSVSKNGALPDVREIKNALKGSDALAGCSAQRHRVNFVVRSGMSQKKTIECVGAALQQAASLLRSLGYINCCQACCASKPVDAYLVGGSPQLLCQSCFAEQSALVEQKQQTANQKKENIAAGIVGALLGSILGAAVIVILGQLGYVAALSGIVIAMCTLKGYELMGSVLSVRGVVISAVIMLGMIHIGNRVDWAITAANYFDVSFFDSFRAIPMLLREGVIEAKTYYINLAMVYLFALLGAIPTLVSTLKGKQLAQITCKMSADSALVM